MAAVALLRAALRTLILLLCCASLCAAESPPLPGSPRPTSAERPAATPPSLTRAASDGEAIHRARFSLAAGDPDAPRGGGATADERDRRWLPWLIAGGVVVLLLAGSVAAASGSTDDAAPVVVPVPGAEPGVGTPMPGEPTTPPVTEPGPPPVVAPPTTPGTPGPEGPPGAPDTGVVIDDPGARSPTRAPVDELVPRQGVFLSLGTRRDGKRATARSGGFEERGRSLSLGYDRLLASSIDAGVSLDLARADTAFDASDASGERRSNTALVFADYRFRPGTRLSGYVGVSLSDGENVRFSDGDELEPLAGQVGASGGGDALARDVLASDLASDVAERPIRAETTTRDALIGVSFAHELFRRGALDVALRLNVDYVRSVLDGYDERGDTSLELSFADRVQDSLGARVGVELVRAIGTSRGVLLPQLGIDWIHESRADPARVVGTLRENPAFGRVSRGDEPDRGYGSAHLGLSFAAANGLQAFAAWESVFAHDFRDSDTVSVGVRLELR